MNDVMYSSATCEWETPQGFFDELDREFHFTLDPCATLDNAKCGKYYTREQDGLKQDWTGERVYCNPPYGRDMPQWIEKCARHAAGGYCCDAPASADGHAGASQMDLRQGGDQVHQGPVEIRRQQEQRPIPVYGGGVQAGIVMAFQKSGA